MSRNTPKRRARVQRLGAVGLGAAAILAGTASSAGAATGVVIPLEPGEVTLSAYPTENVGGAMDPMADPNATQTLTPVEVRYGGTITVALPAELDDSSVGAELAFDDDGDGTPDVTYSSAAAPGSPFFLTVTGQGTGSILVTLPADDGTGVNVADLSVEPLDSTLSQAFTYYDPVLYSLAFDPAANPAVTVEPELVAVSQVPCNISSPSRCPFPTPIAVGSAFTLDLTAGSVLRELGITDLTGVQLGLQQLDANGDGVGDPVPLTAQVSGSTADVVIPAGTAAGSYALVIAQPTSSGVSIVAVELTVVTPAPAGAPSVAEPATPAASPAATRATNVGLRSNTGVEVVEAGSTGTVAVTTGVALLALAGAGGVAVARTRRRPSVEGGSCEA